MATRDVDRVVGQLGSPRPRAELDAGWGSRARGVRVSLSQAWLGPTHLVAENLFSNLSLARPPSPTSTKWQDVPGDTQALAQLMCAAGPLSHATSGWT